MASINPNNPFNFAYTVTGSPQWWATAQTFSGDFGSQSTNHSISAGCFNTADSFGSAGSSSGLGSSPFNGSNFPFDGSSPGGYAGPAFSYDYGFGSTPENFWEPDHAYSVGEWIIDSAFHVQKVTTAGKSGNGLSGAPMFNDHGSTTPDGGVTWTDQGLAPLIGNNGNGDGTDSFGDVTVLITGVALNPSFVVDNIYYGQGSIGLYGRSRGLGTTPNNPGSATFPATPPNANDWSIGVLGQSSKGCGVYGLTTDDYAFPNQPSHGIGVVGRSVGGEALENTSVEQIMGWSDINLNPANASDGAIGVLGQSLNGPGVRGHGGPLQRVTPPAATPETPPLQAYPGGVFSSGRRQYIPVDAFNSLLQEVSPDSCAQLRLVPSICTALPETAHIGDLFLQVLDYNEAAAAQLWICTGYLGSQDLANASTPWWRPVLMGDPVLAGGSKTPEVTVGGKTWLG